MQEVYVLTPDREETLIVFVEEGQKVATLKKLVVEEYDRGNGKMYLLCDENGNTLRGMEFIKERLEYQLNYKRKRKKENNKQSTNGKKRINGIKEEGVQPNLHYTFDTALTRYSLFSMEPTKKDLGTPSSTEQSSKQKRGDRSKDFIPGEEMERKKPCLDLPSVDTEPTALGQKGYGDTLVDKIPFYLDEGKRMEDIVTHLEGGEGMKEYITSFFTMENTLDSTKETFPISAGPITISKLEQEIEETKRKKEILLNDLKQETDSEKKQDLRDELKFLRNELSKQAEHQRRIERLSLKAKIFPSSPKKTLGKPIEMSVDGLLIHILTLQREKVISQGYIHSTKQLSFKLQGREEAIKTMTKVFRKRHKSMSVKEIVFDRTEYPMVVCSGMPGLGKTRMLEEWKSLFRSADIPEPYLGVLVSYGNGHGPIDLDNKMPIEASFSWRMLHQLFVENNTNNTEAECWYSKAMLPNNANELTLKVALKVIYRFAETFGLIEKDQILSLFIGIDEYQAIPVGSDYSHNSYDPKANRDKTLLWQLISVLVECSREEHIHIYPAFAGTKWGPLSLTGSSTAYIELAPLPLLHPQSMENVVASHPEYESSLTSPSFRRHLFFFGGIPRPSIQYTLKEPFDDCWDVLIQRTWKVLPAPDMLRLISVAVRDTKVDISSSSGIFGKSTWKKLHDQGLCLFRKDYHLSIPYSVFRLAAGIYPSDLDTLAEKCLVQNLRYLCDHIDAVLYDNEPWRLWEKFGACFFAIKINALQILGETDVTFDKLCTSSRNGCLQEVVLAPTKVYEIEEEISEILPPVVTETLDHKELNWITGNKDIHYVLINGKRGVGVDIFSALPLADDSGGMLLYLDQRKLEARPMGPKRVEKLRKAASIIPSCLPSHSIYVVGLFSLLISFQKKLKKLPENTFVLTFPEHEEYHGCLAMHPACSPFIDINFVNKSTLQLLKSITSIVDDIILQRCEKKFTNIEEFKSFCESKGHALSEEDEQRVVAYNLHLK